MLPNIPVEERLALMRAEIELANRVDTHQKDIIIVVHNQLQYIKQCIESVYKTTKNFHLYLWDNGSGLSTSRYLTEIANKHSNVTLHRSELNLGFIQPNNQLAKLGTSPFIILLNSDTIVMPGWDCAMLSVLEQRPELMQVGYSGGLLNAECVGMGNRSGEDIDYIEGWCTCVRRNWLNENPLFDEEHLKFAYGEDSDLSLRIKEKGHKIYVMYLALVYHYGGKTTSNLKRTQEQVRRFDDNHIYMRKRWSKYLETERALVKHASWAS